MKMRDAIAGLSVAGLMLPEAVAYAGIAGLPPQRALFAAIAGTLVYALLGRSRFAIVAPTSSSAAILAAILATFPASAGDKGMLATIAVALAGGLFVLAATLRLGGLTGFVARPVLRGFAFGLAITIILKQVPTLLGLDIHAPNLFVLLLELASQLRQVNITSAVLGCAALAALFAAKRLPTLPGAFIVLLGGIAVSYLSDLAGQGIAVVGLIHTVPPEPFWPDVSVSMLSQLTQLTLPLVLILFAESWGTMRSLALRHGDTVEPNRELTALGFANIASALVQGLPVGAGFSAGSAAESAGAQTRVTGLIAGLCLAVLIIVAAPMIAYLPEPVLAAVVIAALTHALDPRPLLRLWHIDRDQFVGLAAAIGVLVLGVVNGMLLAIGLSLVALLQRMAAPDVVELGCLPESRDYVSRRRHPEAIAPAGMAIWRPGEPLFFANAERVLNKIVQASLNRVDTHVIISLEESFDLDSTALEALMECDQRLLHSGRHLHLARVRDHIRDLLLRDGASDLGGRCFYSVDDAVMAVGSSLARPITNELDVSSF